MSGPLTGLRVVELAGLGPAPHAATMLVGLGADVVRVARTAPTPADELEDPTIGGRHTEVADLRDPADRERVLALVDPADVLMEGFRPGVTERLGIGPDLCAARNPRLVYARMTGWGQTGPRAGRAGHDINYIALTGALHAIGRAGERPVPPLNLLGDYGGGSMLLLTGILSALYERERSGLGQVLDVAMVDGALQLFGPVVKSHANGRWRDERGANFVDGGLACYDTYECADGRYVAVGAMEPRFWAELLAGLGLDPAGLPDRFDLDRAPELRERLATVLATRTRNEWDAHFADRDACLSPVLSIVEAAADPHLTARGTFGPCGSVAVAPRFSRSDTALTKEPA